MSNSDEIDSAIKTLEALTQDTQKLAQLSNEQYVALMKAAGKLSRPDKWEAIKRHKANFRVKRQKLILHDKTIRAKTGIREARLAPVFEAPPETTIHSEGAFQTLVKARRCYVCKAGFTELHFFYDTMCIPCGDFNYKKRFQTASLDGQVAVITGSRLKIGYQASLMMLRAGARVIATTRFPIDAAQRFAREADFPKWSSRLQVHGLDLRHIPSVEIFSRYIETTIPRLDILINNAAQTVRRPPGFYAHLMEGESTPFSQLSPDVQKILKPHQECQAWLDSHGAPLPQAAVDAGLLEAWHGGHPAIGLRASARLSQIPYTIDQSLSAEEIFPRGELDADLQQVDLRKVNSWRLKLADVPSAEMLEVQLVNSVAPFVLCSKLVPLMRRDNTGKKHIVNVSAMEGKFNRFTKTDKHPHTNMAKAALNMMTLTSAKDLVEDGIFMNAVDTGWVTDEDPAHLSVLKEAEHDFHPPLDIVDGAARVCDPFFDGINTGEHWCGKFLKDYKPTDW